MFLQNLSPTKEDTRRSRFQHQNNMPNKKGERKAKAAAKR
jgi:hypothetical protein